MIAPVPWDGAYLPDQGEVVEGARRGPRLQGLVVLKDDQDDECGTSVTNPGNLRAKILDASANAVVVLEEAGMGRREILG